MEKIKFTADSTCDLSADLIKQLDLTIINFYVSLKDKSYRDGIDISPQIIYDFVEKHKILPKTAAPSPEDFTELFSKYNKDYDAVIHFTISNKLSASNQNANTAVQNFDNVYIIDSLLLSSGTSMLIFLADKLRKQGKSAKEIVDFINENKHKVVTSFVIDTLEYLHKGGRCSGLARIGATIFKIHPVLLLKEGAITVYKKLKGKLNKVHSDYIDIFAEAYKGNIDNEMTIITHTCDSDTVENFKQYLQKKFNFNKVYITDAGSTVTSHCGKNTIGFMFFTK